MIKMPEDRNCKSYEEMKPIKGCKTIKGCVHKAVYGTCNNCEVEYMRKLMEPKGVANAI